MFYSKAKAKLKPSGRPQMEPGTSREAQAGAGCPKPACRRHEPPGEEAATAGEMTARDAEKRKDSEEELDPRIQEELEHLNQASEEINTVELQLDVREEDARSSYRRILTDSARRLNAHGSQLGACIEKARPYYEAHRLAKEAQQETQKAALRYERAASMHTAAREMVHMAEQGLLADKNTVDSTWQEMLNHATAKVNEAEEERLCSEREHQQVTQLCQDAEARVQALQKALKKVILKSKPYFELKAQFNHILEEHKAKVVHLEEQVSKVKTRYFVALRNLEQISEQIHAQRAQNVVAKVRPEGGRSSPIGAEAEVKGAPGVRVSTCVGVSGVESDWADGEKTRLWVERHRESGWGQREQLDADFTSLVSLQSISFDLEKCDSEEHLGDLGYGGSARGDEWDCDNQRPVSRELVTEGSQLKTEALCEEKQDSLVKQHQRSFSL